MSQEPNKKILFRNKDIVIFTLTWQPGDHGIIHYHSGSHISLTKVLQGQITETHFDKIGDKFSESISNIYYDGQVLTDGSLEAHELSNKSDSPTITLHTEMPPMQETPVQKEKIILWRK
ncbi:MAG: hypothetical protein HY226_01185 [Candidatus Vogelbacteria bacterium]|nr:hypothetical protein [Candidatus Vogelbacteria bacterium]